MGKKSQRKGYRGEHKLVKELAKYGISAKRVPLSGRVEGFKGDIVLEINKETKKAEVKVRQEGFRKLYQWLNGNDFLFIRQVSEKEKDKPYLVLMSLETFVKLIKQ